MRARLGATIAIAFLIAGASAALANETGTATVRIVTVPALGSGTFGFTGTPSGSLTVNGAEGTLTASRLTARDYVSNLAKFDPAAVAAGYQLTSVTCDDTDSTGDALSRRAKFRIGAGEVVTCTFLLTKQNQPQEPEPEPAGPESPQPSAETPGSQTPGTGASPSPIIGGDDPDPEPGPSQSCICPLAGTWNANNLPGVMVCTGKANLSMPLAPNRQSGTMEVQDGCDTVVASGMSEDEATIVMHRNNACGFTGTVGGSQQGIPMEIEFHWSLESERKITGSLHSTVTEQGMTCNMSRRYELDFAY